jgi:hypothetical protein
MVKANAAISSKVRVQSVVPKVPLHKIRPLLLVVRLFNLGFAPFKCRASGS